MRTTTGSQPRPPCVALRCTVASSATGHLVFAGYSLRDSDFNELAVEVANALQRSGTSHRRIGTVLSLAPMSTATIALADIKVVNVGDDDPEEGPADAWLLEIFLDQMAWRAAEGESSWVLDDRYARLDLIRFDGQVSSVDHAA